MSNNEKVIVYYYIALFIGLRSKWVALVSSSYLP